MTQQIQVGGNTKRSKLGVFTVTLPAFADLPEASREFIVQYGLKQYLADGMAGAADRDSAQAGIDARVANLESGEFKRRSGEAKAKPDSVEQRALKLAKAIVRALVKSKKLNWDAEAVNEAAKAYLEGPKGQDTWDEAYRQIEAEREAAQAAESEMDDDVWAALGIDKPDADEDDEDEED